MKTNENKIITKNKFKIPKWIKVISCIILMWIVVYSVDYIRVTNYYRKPIFSITVKSNRVTKDNADYIEKKYIGIGYSFYTRGDVENNKKEYVLVTLIFLVGIFLGVMFINNIQEAQMAEITEYLKSFTEKLKNTEKLETYSILKTTILENVILAITLWFFGTTVIGIPIVFGIILYRGFCLGYSIASIITIMGAGKGIIFVLTTLVLQNIIFIPVLLALAVSGFKLYKSIIKDNRKENIKIEIIRHTMFSLIMLLLLIISSIIEVYISVGILKCFIKYF